MAMLAPRHAQDSCASSRPPHGICISAARPAELHLSQPAVSIQLKQLETEVGTAIVRADGPADASDLAPASSCAGHAARRAGATAGSRRGDRRASRGLPPASCTSPRRRRRNISCRVCWPNSAEHRPGLKVRLTVKNRQAWSATSPTTRSISSSWARRRPALDTVAVRVRQAPARDHRVARASARKKAPRASRTARWQRLFSSASPVRARATAMERAFSAQNFRPAETIEIGSNETIKQAVMAGMGVSFLSLHTTGPRACDQAACRAAGDRHAGDARLVRHSSRAQASFAGGGGIQGLSGRRGRATDRTGHALKFFSRKASQGCVIRRAARVRQAPVVKTIAQPKRGGGAAS